jgi:transcription elongation factor GreB
MGRWRPPVKQGSPYITAEGAARLRAELLDLWREQRPEVVRALTEAAAEGDRSENAEYTYRKKQLAEIDRRVRYLSRRLDEATVVRAPPADREKVFFGATVTLARDDTPVRYRIVGADEIDAARGYISIDSPLARALLGRRAGDTVEVDLPDGRERLQLVAVEYS